MSDVKFDNGTFMLGDCLERMREIPDGSVDMVLCDLPYGTTACSWDQVIPFEPLWGEYWRLCKPNAAVVLTASQPFASALGASQIRHLKYDWIWEKSRATGHLHAKNKPLKAHEDVLVFSKGVVLHTGQSKKRIIYHPQGLVKLEKSSVRKERNRKGSISPGRPSDRDTASDVTNYPKSVLKFPSENEYLHPTQKPVALFEYLIRTYTDEGMTVLDNCAGSGTTAIAAERSNRRWICIERDPEYFAKAVERVRNEVASKGLFA